MSEPLMSLEDRVSALEAALTESEQWNVCTCGHHGSAHDMRNKCMVCDCRHFGTRTTPDSRRPVALIDGATIAAMRRVSRYLDARDDIPDNVLASQKMVDAYLTKAVTP